MVNVVAEDPSRRQYRTRWLAPALLTLLVGLDVWTNDLSWRTALFALLAILTGLSALKTKP